MNGQTEASDPKASTEFWSKLWSEPVQHIEGSKKVKEKLRDTPKQENIIITAKELKRAIARMSNWKVAGRDHVQGFWFKKATQPTTSVCQYWSRTSVDDRRMHSIHHERQEQRNSCRKLHTNCLPSTDMESVDKYVLRSNVWTFELPGIIAK